MATGWHMLLGGLPLMALSIAKEGSELGPRLQQLTGEQHQNTLEMTCFADLLC